MEDDFIRSVRLWHEGGYDARVVVVVGLGFGQACSIVSLVGQQKSHRMPLPESGSCISTRSERLHSQVRLLLDKSSAAETLQNHHIVAEPAEDAAEVVALMYGVGLV